MMPNTLKDMHRELVTMLAYLFIAAPLLLIVVPAVVVFWVLNLFVLHVRLVIISKVCKSFMVQDNRNLEIDAAYARHALVQEYLLESWYDWLERKTNTIFKG